MATLQDFKAQIQKAKTKEELHKISYSALVQDQHALTKKNSLYEKVIDLCIKRKLKGDILS